MILPLSHHRSYRQHQQHPGPLLLLSNSGDPWAHSLWIFGAEYEFSMLQVNILPKLPNNLAYSYLSGSPSLTGPILGWCGRRIHDLLGSFERNRDLLYKLRYFEPGLIILGFTGFEIFECLLSDEGYCITIPWRCQWLMPCDENVHFVWAANLIILKFPNIF